MLVLTWVGSYAVRKREELRDALGGPAEAGGAARSSRGAAAAEPDFGAATVLFATGFAVLFLAGARLRYVLVLVLPRPAAHSRCWR